MVERFIQNVTDTILNNGKFTVIIECGIWNATHDISPEDIEDTDNTIIIYDATGGLYSIDKEKIESDGDVYMFYLNDNKVCIIF